MKKIIISAILIATGIVVIAQNEDDALRFSMDRFSGTARSMSLSNAMGALGGDFSSIGINPAGIAVYRSSEFTFTPSLVYNKSNTSQYGIKSSDDKYSMPFQQIGFVGTYKPMRDITSGIVSSHFSLGYNRTNSFARRYFTQGNQLQHSLLDRFTYDANTTGLNNFYSGVADDIGLIFNTYPGYLNAYEHLNPFDLNDNTVYFGPKNGINQQRAVDEKGNAGEFHFGGGVNISNKVMLGGTLGINTFSYRRSMHHYEEVAGQNYQEWYHPDYYEYYYTTDELGGLGDNFGGWGLDNFTFNENLTTIGVGVNLKVGVIYKPINSVRIGAAFHSPVFYTISEELSTSINANYFYIDVNEAGTEYIHTPLPQENSGTQYSAFPDYGFRTPFKGIGSLAFVFGQHGLISADYEYVNYNAMKFVSLDSNFDDKRYFDSQNKVISETFRNAHNLRFGVEFRPGELFTLRGGYGLYQSPYKKTFLNNSNIHQTFSFGVGLRMNNMFMDFAYMLRYEKFIYMPYHLDDVDYISEKPEEANITNNNHQVAITLGWRF